MAIVTAENFGPSEAQPFPLGDGYQPLRRDRFDVYAEIPAPPAPPSPPPPPPSRG